MMYKAKHRFSAVRCVTVRSAFVQAALPIQNKLVAKLAANKKRCDSECLQSASGSRSSAIFRKVSEYAFHSAPG